VTDNDFQNTYIKIDDRGTRNDVG